MLSSLSVALHSCTVLGKLTWNAQTVPRGSAVIPAGKKLLCGVAHNRMTQPVEAARSGLKSQLDRRQRSNFVGQAMYPYRHPLDTPCCVPCLQCSVLQMLLQYHPSQH